MIDNEEYKIKLNNKRKELISNLLNLKKEKLNGWISLRELINKAEKNDIFLWSYLDNLKVKGVVIGRKVGTKIWFKHPFIEPTKEIINLTKKAIKKAGTKRKLGEILNFSSKGKSIDDWLKKRSWFPLDSLEKIIKYLGIKTDIEEILHNKKLRGGGGRETLTYNKNLNKELARSLGFILTDGTISLSKPLTALTQKDTNLSNKYGIQIYNFFKINKKPFKIKCGSSINSAVLRYVLCRFYGMIPGYKSHNLKIPKKIISSNNKEIIKHFIAGVWDGDGCITQDKNKKPEFTVGSKNKNFISELQFLLKKLLINSNMVNGKSQNYLKIIKYKDTIKFFLEIQPLMLHTKRKNKSKSLFLNSFLNNRIKVNKTQSILSLINNSSKRIGGKNNLGKYLINKNIITLKPRSIENWGNFRKGSSNPPLKVVMELNLLLKRKLNFGLQYPYNKLVEIYSNELY